MGKSYAKPPNGDPVTIRQLAFPESVQPPPKSIKRDKPLKDRQQTAGKARQQQPKPAQTDFKDDAFTIKGTEVQIYNEPPPNYMTAKKEPGAFRGVVAYD